MAGSALVWAAAVSYTAVFCAVEWDLRNPYTRDDILALLYNLGHLGERLPGAVLALGILTVARSIRVEGMPAAPGGGVATIAAGLSWSLALFFVPALAVRYGVNVATPAVAAAAGALIVLVAAAQAVRAGLPERRRIAGWATTLAIAAALGLAAAYAALRWVTDTFYEAALLRAAAAFLIIAVLVCGLLDHYVGGAGTAGARRRSAVRGPRGS